MAFFSGLGASILAATGIAGGVSSLAASTIVGTAAAAGIAGAAGVGIAQAGKAINQMTKVPEVSSTAASAVPETVKETAGDTITKSQQTATASITAKKRAASRSRSIFSSPLGISGEANTVKKSLLGE